MTKSESIAELAVALAKAQSQIKGAKKDAANPFFKSKYADLESVWDAVKDPLTANGLSVVQLTDLIDGKTILQTMLIHTSGQWLAGNLPVNPIKDDPQGQGSAITYARRYSLAALMGVYQVDDDAEAAMGRKPEPRKSDWSVYPDQPGPNDGNYNPNAPKPKPGPKPAPTDQSAPADPERNKLNARLMAIHRPFLTANPETPIVDVLRERYDVNETRFLSISQLQDLIKYMEERTGIVPDPEPPKNRAVVREGAITAAVNKVTAPLKTPMPVTANQVKRLWAIAGAANWSKDQVHQYVKRLAGVDHADQLNMQDYDQVCGVMTGANFDVAYKELDEMFDSDRRTG